MLAWGNMKITEARIKKIAENVWRRSFLEIISSTDIERVIASKAAADAANEFARILQLTLREHGVVIE